MTTLSTARAPGFSLIELMTVLLIIGLLAAVAWPSYQSHVRRGHRVQAQAALLEAQHFMERHYGAHGRYVLDSGAAPTLPARLQVLPAQGPVRYRLRLEAVQAGSFSLRADPEGVMADDPCGSLLLASTGARSRTGTGLSVAQCWQ
jgi:type IV pilus assembly protein PilE